MVREVGASICNTSVYACFLCCLQEYKYCTHVLMTLHLCTVCLYMHIFLYHLAYVHVSVFVFVCICIHVAASEYVCVLYCVGSAPWRM